MLQRTRQLLLLADGAPQAGRAALRRWALECSELPLPGRGRTLERWQVLEQLGHADLSLAKLVESHLDAVAILAEADRADLVDRLRARLGDAAPVWQVWAAEPPGRRVYLEGAGPRDEHDDSPLRLRGTKAWCSGAAWTDIGLMTVWPEEDAGQRAQGSGPWLVAVPLDQPGITRQPCTWAAAGMAGAGTVELSIDGAQGWPVGPRGWYLSRPGFWHGGAGVAAAWLGGTRAVATALARGVATNGAPGGDAARAALGRADVAMQSAVALLRQTAAAIDARPQADARVPAQVLRLAVDRTAREVMDLAETTLGPGPMVGDARLAATLQDLRVFIRQCHAERDAAALAAARGPDAFVSRWTP